MHSLRRTGTGDGTADLKSTLIHSTTLLRSLLSHATGGEARPMSGIGIDRETDIAGLVDVQPTFMPGGELAVSEGDAVVPAINRLLGRFDHAFATQDWHRRRHSRSEEHTYSLHDALTIFIVACNWRGGEADERYRNRPGDRHSRTGGRAADLHAGGRARSLRGRRSGAGDQSVAGPLRSCIRYAGLAPARAQQI